jgi:hypothetical protein
MPEQTHAEHSAAGEASVTLLERWRTKVFRERVLSLIIAFLCSAGHPELKRQLTRAIFAIAGMLPPRSDLLLEPLYAGWADFVVAIALHNEPAVFLPIVLIITVQIIQRILNPATETTLLVKLHKRQRRGHKNLTHRPLT